MLQVVVQLLILAAILFIASGRVDWVGRGPISRGVGIVAINALVLPPELIAERGQIREDVKGWDKVLASLIGIPRWAR